MHLLMRGLSAISLNEWNRLGWIQSESRSDLLLRVLPAWGSRARDIIRTICTYLYNLS